jgi:hypothetical protein
VAPADVLVATVLVGLVLLVMAPAVREARQQSEVDVCLTKLSRVMRATSMYLTDYQDRYPFDDGDPSGTNTWYPLGMTNDPYWANDTGGVSYHRGYERPLNPYILGHPLQPDAVDPVTGEVIVRTPMPEVACPADSFSHQRQFHHWEDGTNYNISSY